MAVGEYMSVASLTGRGGGQPGGERQPVAGRDAAVGGFVHGRRDDVPTGAVVLSPARLRVALILGSALVALVACGIAGGRLAGIPARTDVLRLLSGGALAVAVTYASPAWRPRRSLPRQLVDVCALTLVLLAVRR
jgi:hypothetical protein